MVCVTPATEACITVPVEPTQHTFVFVGDRGQRVVAIAATDRQLCEIVATCEWPL
ncbi:MAG: hypothetical protein JWL83_2021 [Actinomycetia bacterium]|nr:hypothetical protein [Actinomycetes bacterium]